MREVSPASAEELADAVRRAAEDGLRVKTVGTGHSFTSIAATDGVLIRPGLLTGIRRIDREAMTVTVESGTPLKRLNVALAREGLSLTNMGDIMEQTVAGATSTGTHGTGRESASDSRADPRAGTGDGLGRAAHLLGEGESGGLRGRPDRPRRPRCRHGHHVRGRAGLPAHRARGADDLRPGHLGFRRAPRGERALRVLLVPPHGQLQHQAQQPQRGPRRSPGRISGWIEDEFLSNGVFQLACSLGRAVPPVIPSIAKVSSRALSARTYTDIPYKVFTSPRRVRFLEMEYALPREAAVAALRELKAMVERSPLKVSFPVEVRTAPADDIALSTASGRDTAYIAVHLYRGTPHRAYFTAVERIMTAHGGRPHWGKVHTRDAAYLSEAYPRFAEFTALRDRLDPDRLFANDYLRRVLGD
ncbi:L-gulono-1,4-lactone dehydrogenase [Streptomyces tanashiensis]